MCDTLSKQLLIVLVSEVTDSNRSEIAKFSQPRAILLTSDGSAGHMQKNLNSVK